MPIYRSSLSKVINKDDFVRISKNRSHQLPSRFHCLRLLRGWFACSCPLFRLFLCLRCVKIDPSFIKSVLLTKNSLGLRRKSAKAAIELVIRLSLFFTVSRPGTHLVDSIKIVKIYYKNGESIAETVRNVKSFLGHREASSRPATVKLVQKF